MKPQWMCLLATSITGLSLVAGKSTVATELHPVHIVPKNVTAKLACSGHVNGTSIEGTVNAELTTHKDPVVDEHTTTAAHSDAPSLDKHAAVLATSLHAHPETAVHKHSTQQTAEAVTGEDMKHDPHTETMTVSTRGAQRVTLHPNQPIMIYMKPGSGPCPETATTLLNPELLPPGATRADPAEIKKKAPVIAQHIAAARGPELTAGDAHVLDLIAQQPQLLDLSLADRNHQMNRYVEFLGMLRGAQLHRTIKLPRMVFVGESDGDKYRLLESLLGVAGAFDPPPGGGTTGPRFAGPVRFTLVNDSAVAHPTFAIVTREGEVASAPGKSHEENVKSDSHSHSHSHSHATHISTRKQQPLKKDVLYTAITEAFLAAHVRHGEMGMEPVEVEIRGHAIASLVFVDLPRVAPAASDPASQTANESVRAALFRKYLAASHGVIVVVGPAEREFARWEGLELAKTFDRPLQRTVVIAVDPPTDPATDWHIEGVLAGLWETAPHLRDPNALLFTLTVSPETREPTELLPRAFCAQTVAGCGRPRVIQALQLRLLRTWRALQPGARHIIETRAHALAERLAGYDEFERLTGEARWKALVAAVTASLAPTHESSCHKTPLLLNRQSLWDADGDGDGDGEVSATAANHNHLQWPQLFAQFRATVASLPAMPHTVNQAELHDAIRALREVGPVASIASQLTRLVTAQLDSLHPATTQLVESVGSETHVALDRILATAPQFAPFPVFATWLRAQYTAFVAKRLTEARAILDLLVRLEMTGGWEATSKPAGGKHSETATSDHPAAAAIQWTDLLTAANDTAAFHVLEERAVEGFAAIQGRMSVLVPRVLTLALLDASVLATLHDQLLHLYHDTPEHAQMTQLSSAAVVRLAELRARLCLYHELVVRTRE